MCDKMRQKIPARGSSRDWREREAWDPSSRQVTKRERGKKSSGARKGANETVKQVENSSETRNLNLGAYLTFPQTAEALLRASFQL